MKRLTTTAIAAALLLAGCAQDNPDEDVAMEEAATAAATSSDIATTADGDAADAVSEPTVAFELSDMTGNPRSSSEWDGKPKLVNFWATWCAPCRREIPLLKETQDKYTDLDLQVIGIAVDVMDEVVAYAEEADFNYPILVGEEDAMAVAESSGIDFIGLPFTMVVAPSGELIKTHVGEIVEDHVMEITDVLAAMQSGELDLDGARQRLGRL